LALLAGGLAMRRLTLSLPGLCCACCCVKCVAPYCTSRATHTAVCVMDVQKPLWCSSSAGAHPQPVLTFSWCSPSAGAHLQQVLTFSWCSPSAGAHLQLVLAFSSCSALADAHLQLVLAFS